MYTPDPRDYLPDIRDGLTHRDRIVLQCLYDLQRQGRSYDLGGMTAPHVRCCCGEAMVSVCHCLPLRAFHCKQMRLNDESRCCAPRRPTDGPFDRYC
jgi:hypothetical protein